MPGNQGNLSGRLWDASLHSEPSRLELSCVVNIFQEGMWNLEAHRQFSTPICLIWEAE